MKRLLTLSFVSVLAVCASDAATLDWWLQPTICRPNPANCYPGMGAGYADEMWDKNANCWGMKLICPTALKNASSTAPVEMGRVEISRGDNLNPDFNIDILNEDCFGVRRTMANGSLASMNGKYVNVWCPGVLESPDEELPNGEILYQGQPSCRDLAEYGYVSVLNGRCYGKYYNQNDYFIDCGTSTTSQPQRLIILNGADINSASKNTPSDRAAADARFDMMQKNAADQRTAHSKDN